MVITTNELNVWDDSLDGYDMTSINASISEGITDLTNVEDIKSDDEINIDYFQIPGMLVKGFFLLFVAIATIPLTGAVMLYYGVPLSICAMFEVLNILMVGIAVAQFASNRRISQ
ncbi:MAG: hypothetical protein WC415_06070 [Patescibacteria group bacterium]|jgi:hypothetical protein